MFDKYVINRIYEQKWLRVFWSINPKIQPQPIRNLLAAKEANKTKTPKSDETTSSSQTNNNRMSKKKRGAKNHRFADKERSRTLPLAISLWFTAANQIQF